MMDTPVYLCMSCLMIKQHYPLVDAEQSSTAMALGDCVDWKLFLCIDYYLRVINFPRFETQKKIKNCPQKT